MFFTTYLRLIFGLDVPFLRSLFVIRSSARAARTVICSSFVRSLFVLCSFFVRSLFVLCSSFVRLLFVHFLSARAARTVFCSSHFSVTTLPLIGSSLRIGEYVIGEKIFCSSFLYLPVQLAPSFIHCRATVEPL